MTAASQLKTEEELRMITHAQGREDLLHVDDAYPKIPPHVVFGHSLDTSGIEPK